MTPKPKPKPSVEVKPLPNIARRAIGLVNVELRRTVVEAAELVGVDLRRGWRLNEDGSAFVRQIVDTTLESQ